MNIPKLQRLLKVLQNTQDNETRQQLAIEIIRECNKVLEGQRLGAALLKKSKRSRLVRLADVCGRIAIELAKHELLSTALYHLHRLL